MGTNEKDSRLYISSTLLKTDANENIETQAVHEVTSEMQTMPKTVENNEATAEKEKKKGAKFKKNVIKKGKDSAIGFVISKIVTSVLSAALGAVMVLITQHTFKDNIKDYVNNYYVEEVEADFNELKDYIDGIEEMDVDEAVEYFENHRIYDKSKDLLETVVTYSSDDKEVNELHNQLTDICKDIHRLSYMCYFASENNEDFTVEYRTSYQVIVDKMEVFVETRDEILEKHDIELKDIKE